MAKNHNISVITVENAYAQLLVEGYIFSKEKRGYFASEISGQYLNNGGINGNKEKIVETKVSLKSGQIKKKIQDTKKQWLVDFNSNHIMYDSFPFSIW